jgi:hypothetical protein
MLFNPRTLAIAGSIGALSFAAAPIAQAASTTHHPTAAQSRDHSRDRSDPRHHDRTPDRATTDRSPDGRDR